MNNCLSCVTADIEGLVTSYYEVLGLAPWHVFANRHRDQNVRSDMRDQARQTGRTTHGLLEAFATAAKEHANFVFVGRSRFLWEVAEDLLSRLQTSEYFQAPFRLTQNVTNTGKTVRYEDHYHG